MDEEQQSMSSASTADYTATASSSNNKGTGSSSGMNAIKTAVTFGSSTKDTTTSTKDTKSGRQKMGSLERGLSAVSRMYDIDGDGVLDEAELAMRNLDSSGRGHLTNDSVYKLMQEQMAQQRQLFKFKKIMIGLSVVVFLLTLSNLGTSFAAAYLAKDTSVNDKDVLVNSHTNKALSTQTTSAQYGADRDLEVQDLIEGEVEGDPKIAFQTFVDKGGEGGSSEPWEGEEQDSSGRRLGCEEIEVWNDVTEEYDTELECAGSSGGEGLVIDERLRGASGSCSNIAQQCNQRNNVDIYRKFSNGERVTINICGPSTKVTSIVKKGRYTFKASGMTKIDMQMTDIGCKFDGPDLAQQPGETCDTGSDCTRGHKCYQMPAKRVSSCKNSCRSAFKGGSRNSKIRFNECASNCEGNTCELENDRLQLAGTTPEPSRSPSAKPTTGRPTTSLAPSLSPSLSSAPSTTSSPTKPCEGPCPPSFPNGCTQYGCNNAEGNVEIKKDSMFTVTQGPDKDKGNIYFTSKGNPNPNFKYIGTCEPTSEGTCFVPE
jgi:hypothetical protein